MDIASASAAFQGLQAAVGLVRSAQEARDDATTRKALAELQSVLLSVQSSAIQVQQDQITAIQRIDGLERENAKLKAWSVVEEEYEIDNAGQLAWVYRRIDDNNPPESAQWLCPTCFEDRRRSYLQREIRTPGMSQFLVCPVCSTELIVVGFRQPGQSSATRRR